MESQNLFSKIPSVDQLLREEKIIQLIEENSKKVVLESIREFFGEVRTLILKKEIIDISEDFIIDGIKSRVSKNLAFKLKKVINGTGIVIHTNLGRSPLPESIKNNLIDTVFGYSNLEYDLEKAARGSRYSHLEEIIQKITGAESVLVVNNNAAAVLLVLSTLGRGKEVVVSRGELVEIGGSFRIPKVMEESGAFLKEVGSTNKTHLKDYEESINEHTGALMKVHTSNFKVMGFTKEVSREELRILGDKYELPIIEDMGSGVFIDLSKYGITKEPTVMESLKAGVDIVTFSGDKILGGPQAGIIVGKREYIEKMKKNQLTRALRVDKMTIAALEGVFRLYLDEEVAIREIPGLKMITMKEDEILKKAETLKSKIEDISNALKMKIEADYSQVGGGSMPTELLPSHVIKIVSEKFKPNEIEEAFRKNEVPIIGRISEGFYILDPRTIFEEDYEIIAKAIKNNFC